MKSARVLILLALASTLGFVGGCLESKIESTSVIKQNVPNEKSINFSGVTTVGNHSYIPLDMRNMNPSQHALEILTVLDKFEKTHPNLEVTSWYIEKQLKSFSFSDTDGLWVNHRPRTDK